MTGGPFSIVNDEDSIKSNHKSPSCSGNEANAGASSCLMATFTPTYPSFFTTWCVGPPLVDLDAIQKWKPKHLERLLQRLIDENHFRPQMVRRVPRLYAEFLLFDLTRKSFPLDETDKSPDGFKESGTGGMIKIT